MKKFAINNFLQHLIHDCGLKKEFVNEMMDYAKQQQISFISYLIQTQKIDSSYLAHLLAEEFFLTYIDLDSIDITQIPSSLIDKNILQKYQMLPITYDRKKLVLALVDPTQQLVLDDIRFATGLILEYKIADEKQIVELLKKVKDTSLIKHDITSQVDLSRYKETQLKEDRDLDIALNNSSNDDLTIINYVHKLLIDAIMRTTRHGEHKVRSQGARDRRALTGEAGNASRRQVIVGDAGMNPIRDECASDAGRSRPNNSRVMRTNFGGMTAEIFREHSDSLDASDVHIEPYQDHLKIRFRIDGLLYVMVVLPRNLISRITTRLKIMSQLDIAERRIPQDGRFQLKDIKGRNVDCRLSTCPTIHGEKLVIRILDSNKMLLEIDKLGMNKIQKKEFIQALSSPHGMILVTGPTGSGKTITLYTGLNFLKKSTVNISTVENPIEIILSGINQVNVNPAIGLNFACVLRAFLRQDPDIIMVGEMRDQETAEIGIKAAQTGHLVLSTLHTNNAAESLIRLENMNIPTYNIATSIQLIIAQRLVRRLCASCKIEEKLSKKNLLKLNFPSDIKIYTAKGCSLCTKGYEGRTGIFEILKLTEEIKKIILRKNSAFEINELAQEQGMQTLYFSALEKLKKGDISLLEMKRVIKD